MLSKLFEESLYSQFLYFLIRLIIDLELVKLTFAFIKRVISV